MNSPRRIGFDPLDKADESGEEFKTSGQQKSARIDRFGNEIIARKAARLENIKSQHKLTFVD